MDYPGLSVDVLQIFVEAQQTATSQRLAYQHTVWGERYRSGRFGFPVGQTELGRAPAPVHCLRCRRPLTSADPRVVKSHVQMCGVKPARRPQYR